MDILTLVEEVEVHREVYLSAIRGAMKRVGEKRRFAQSIGITPQYLSYLLSGTRLPSKQIARKLVDALFSNPANRKDILDHIRLAKECELRKRVSEKKEGVVASRTATLNDFRRAHHEATHATDPILARQYHMRIRDGGEIFIGQLNR